MDETANKDLAIMASKEKPAVTILGKHSGIQSKLLSLEKYVVKQDYLKRVKTEDVCRAGELTQRT